MSVRHWGNARTLKSDLHSVSGAAAYRADIDATCAFGRSAPTTTTITTKATRTPMIPIPQRMTGDSAVLVEEWVSGAVRRASSPRCALGTVHERLPRGAPGREVRPADRQQG